MSNLNNPHNKNFYIVEHWKKFAEITGLISCIATILPLIFFWSETNKFYVLVGSILLLGVIPAFFGIKSTTKRAVSALIAFILLVLIIVLIFILPFDFGISVNGNRYTLVINVVKRDGLDVRPANNDVLKKLDVVIIDKFDQLTRAVFQDSRSKIDLSSAKSIKIYVCGIRSDIDISRIKIPTTTDITLSITYEFSSQILAKPGCR